MTTCDIGPDYNLCQSPYKKTRKKAQQKGGKR